MVDFVLVVIELFPYLLQLRRCKLKSVEVVVFRRRWVTLSADFKGKGALPTNHCWCQTTGVIAVSCGIKISAVHHLVLSQYTRLTDGQTDGRTELRQQYRALYYMQSHGKNRCRELRQHVFPPRIISPDFATTSTRRVVSKSVNVYFQSCLCASLFVRVLTFKCIDPRTSFLVRRYAFVISRSTSNTKVTEMLSRQRHGPQLKAKNKSKTSDSGPDALNGPDALKQNTVHRNTRLTLILT